MYGVSHSQIEITMSDSLKTKGNEAFAAKDYASAIKHYTDAIAADYKNSVLYSNRALCHLKLEEWHKALEDCDDGLKYTTDNKTIVKLLFRKASSFAGMGSKKLAVEYYKKVLELDPENQSAEKELNNLDDDMEDLIRPNRIEIPICRTDKLPTEFQDLIEQEDEPITASPNTVKEAENIDLVSQEATDLFHDRVKKESQSPEILSQTLSSMSLLLILKTIPSANKDQAYAYVLSMNSNELIDNFTYGVEPEFVIFYLEATIHVLSKKYDKEIASKAVLHFKTLSRLPRFDLSKAFLDDHLIKTLSNLFTEHGDWELLNSFNETMN